MKPAEDAQPGTPEQGTKTRHYSGMPISRNYGGVHRYQYYAEMGKEQYEPL